MARYGILSLLFKMSPFSSLRLLIVKVRRYCLPDELMHYKWKGRRKGNQLHQEHYQLSLLTAEMTFGSEKTARPHHILRLAGRFSGVL